MATSESDDFESADEELSAQPTKRLAQRRQQQWSSPSTIGSESDDDTEYVPRVRSTSGTIYESPDVHGRPAGERARDKGNKIDNTLSNQSTNQQDNEVAGRVDSARPAGEQTAVDESLKEKEKDTLTKTQMADTKDADVDTKTSMAERRAEAREKRVRPQRPQKLGAKRLGTKVIPQNADVKSVPEDKPAEKELTEQLEQLSTSDHEDRIPERKDTTGTEVSLMTELAEPEELKSNKKFKEIFEPQGWEGVGNDIELPEDLSEEKLQPVLDRLSSAGKELNNPLGGWGGWGNWGVSSLLNTATAGVYTLTTHVTHGLNLLEESVGTPDSSDSAGTKEQEESSPVDEKPSSEPESPSLAGFGFGNLMSGVSSITKLVETTSSKMMSGGLDTLEAIGKKTMEVLQEGDPGLKKKRAFFVNESDKPILSQVLREAKEKADAAEKSFEEKQWARKVHFESLFDDYQGLVHLEALEMLSKQSNMKIQQHLIGLTGTELSSIQETLEDVKQLCDPNEEDEEEEESSSDKDLKSRLLEACADLGIDITYDKLCTIWDESQTYLTPPVEHPTTEIFQSSISALAQFTAFSIERFHKTAELLLIKPRRSTVNEADALVQLTRILSGQIGLLANSYCNALHEIANNSDNSEKINEHITTIFLEATNASSYVQDAFKLLIPIVQVGAI